MEIGGLDFARVYCICFWLMVENNHFLKNRTQKNICNRVTYKISYQSLHQANEYFLNIQFFAGILSFKMNLEIANKAVKAAINESEKLNVKMNIAIVDAGGNLIAFSRMDNAWLGSVDIAIKKAKTAIFFNMPTGEIGKLSQPGKPLYNIEHSNGGLITFPGGVPIQSGQNVLIGGIGVSGSTVENDHQVANAGFTAVMDNL